MQNISHNPLVTGAKMSPGVKSTLAGHTERSKHFYLFTTVNIFMVLSISSCCQLCGYKTEYCPFNHRLDINLVCKVLDEQNGRVLVEHYNVDTNQATLSIHENGNTLWIKHPQVETGHPRGHNCYVDLEKGNTIFDKKFNPKDKKSLLVNGEKL